MKENDENENTDVCDKNYRGETEDIASMCIATILEQIKNPLEECDPEPSTSGVVTHISDGLSGGKENMISQKKLTPEIFPPEPNTSAYEMYKVLHSIIETESEIPNIPSASPPPKYYLTPPTYSAVMRMGPPPKDPKKIVDIDSSKILTRVPPPSYAEVEGIWSDLPRQDSCKIGITLYSLSEEVLFGPDPVYIVCPHCSAIVITETYTQRSTATHLTALALCLFGCWPCCILPYFMDSCKNTYHHCPVCNYFFGSYHPW